MRDITDLYMNTSSLGYGYVGANGDQHCPKAQHVPCMVPQARDILNPEESIPEEMSHIMGLHVRDECAHVCLEVRTLSMCQALQDMALQIV